MLHRSRTINSYQPNIDRHTSKSHTHTRGANSTGLSTAPSAVYRLHTPCRRSSVVLQKKFPTSRSKPAEGPPLLSLADGARRRNGKPARGKPDCVQQALFFCCLAYDFSLRLSRPLNLYTHVPNSLARTYLSNSLAVRHSLPLILVSSSEPHVCVLHTCTCTYNVPNQTMRNWGNDISNPCLWKRNG